MALKSIKPLKFKKEGKDNLLLKARKETNEFQIYGFFKRKVEKLFVNSRWRRV